MCGITGYLNTNSAPASLHRCKAMCTAIAHRGPDGEGQWADGPCTLGHRRLSIIDLSDRAAQPMQSANFRYTLTYNGELYNFMELKKELESKGQKFRTTSDTEVLLECISTWGIEKALARFNGMFAFAIWDAQEKKLTIARDRYGIKPLYYTSNGSSFAFGSEIKAIIAGEFRETEINYEGLVEYLTFQNFISDRTLYSQINIVPAGCYMEISLNNPTPQLFRYWDFEFCEPSEVRSFDEYEEELDFLFQRAVKRQLISDVPVGSYLSGGMDSGSITAICAQNIGDLKTFTVGFDSHSTSGIEIGIDERPIAEFMSYKFKTEHYEMVLKAGDMERIMDPLTLSLEEPRVGQCYPNFYAAKLACKFVKVVMSGAGGDEMFGGYPWRYYRGATSLNFDNYVENYYSFWQRLLTRAEITQVLDPIKDTVKKVDTVELFRDVLKGQAGTCKRPEDYINKSLYFEAKTFLHGLLVVEDKLSMAYGLESRVPFLDNEIVDFASKLPTSTKLGNLSNVVREDENKSGKAQSFYQKTNDGKLILRNVMKRHIPEDITRAVKQGFSAPDATWFKGESIEYIRNILFCENTKIQNFLDIETVRNLVCEHFDGEKNRRLLIWSLIYLENWCALNSPQYHSTN